MSLIISLSIQSLPPCCSRFSIHSNILSPIVTKRTAKPPDPRIKKTTAITAAAPKNQTIVKPPGHPAKFESITSDARIPNRLRYPPITFELCMDQSEGFGANMKPSWGPWRKRWPIVPVLRMSGSGPGTTSASFLPDQLHQLSDRQDHQPFLSVGFQCQGIHSILFQPFI